MHQLARAPFQAPRKLRLRAIAADLIWI